MSRSLRGREVERALIARDRPWTSLRNYEGCGVRPQGRETSAGAVRVVMFGKEALEAIIRSLDSRGHSRVFEAGERSVQL